jgi:hypothetical protein
MQFAKNAFKMPHICTSFRIHLFAIIVFYCEGRVCLTTDWTTGVRSPTEAGDFSSSLCVQTGSGAHPSFCTMGTGGPFPGVKRGLGVMLTTHPHLVLMLRVSRSYTSFLPQAPPWRDHFTFYCEGRALTMY